MLAIAAALLLYAPLIRGYFLADDFALIGLYSRLEWSDVPRMFTGDWTQGVWGRSLSEWRPLLGLTFLVDAIVWGPSPQGFLVTNVGLHLAASVLVWRLAATVPGASAPAAVLSLAFFILAPVHEEAVGWISGRGHVLVTLWTVAAVLSLQRFHASGRGAWYVASLAAFMAALASLESAVVVPALLLLRDVVDSGRRSREWLRRQARVHGPFWLLLTAYLVLRYALFGARLPNDTAILGSADVRAWLNPAVSLWLSPSRLSLDTPAWAGLAAASVAAILLVTSLIMPGKPARAEHLRNMLFAAGWVLIATALLVNRTEQRHFYLASVGFAMALGFGSGRVLTAVRPIRHISAVLMVLLLLMHGYWLHEGVAARVRHAQLSEQLHRELDSTVILAAAHPGSAIVVLPELPASRRLFWQWALPYATRPPFSHAAAAVPIVPSFQSYCCAYDDYIREHKHVIDGLATQRAPIFVVEWDRGVGRFMTHEIDSQGFMAGGYALESGPLLGR